jgi:cystathionine beta-lyase/cystathionine gamma-synthase
MHFETKAIHIGSKPDEATGALAPPLYMTSTYAQEEIGTNKGFAYSRVNHPNYVRLEQNLASLEQAEYATVFSSGMAATDAVLSKLRPNEKILISSDLYGGTTRYLRTISEPIGIHILEVDITKLQEVKKLLQEHRPKLLFAESISNPLLVVSDVKALAELAHQFGTELIIDNTFATPYFLNPLALGADGVIHSSSKYLGGHSDLIGGAFVTNKKEWKDHSDAIRKIRGTNPSPFDVWLTQRSIKTLALRMDRHEANAKKIAEFFNGHPLVKNIYYPGLEKHQTHSVAKEHLSGFGGVISVEFNLTFEQTKQLITFFKYFTLAESLGGVESMVAHPATMSHGSLTPEQRQHLGITDGLLRFSIGIEKSEDLISDLEETLSRFT